MQLHSGGKFSISSNLMFLVQPSGRADAILLLRSPQYEHNGHNKYALFER